MSKSCAITLPRFELLKRQPKVPHVSRTVIERAIPNEYGTPIKFVVKRSRNGKQWWVSASLNGMRMSNTVGTAKPAVAERWIKAIEKGTICLSPDE